MFQRLLTESMAEKDKTFINLPKSCVQDENKSVNSESKADPVIDYDWSHSDIDNRLAFSYTEDFEKLCCMMKQDKEELERAREAAESFRFLGFEDTDSEDERELMRLMNDVSLLTNEKLESLQYEEDEILQHKNSIEFVRESSLKSKQGKVQTVSESSNTLPATIQHNTGISD